MFYLVEFMSNPYLELLKMIQKNERSSGTVTSISNNTAFVSTNRGNTRFEISTSTKLKVGDTVSIRNGQVVGKLKQEDSIPHYIV